MPSSPQSLTFPRDGVILEPSPSMDTFIAPPPGLPGQDAHGPSVITLQAPEHSDKEKGEMSSKELDELWDVDPENPRNWSQGKKWIQVVVVGLYTLIAPLGSSMMAPGLPELAENFGIRSDTVLALTLSIFVLAFALAPLVLAPISELYGRRWVLHVGNLVFIAFTVACAYAPSVGALIAFRFLAGAFGSAPLACGGGVISDLFSPNDRAMAMAIYSVGPLLGPVIGPVAGGFITETVGIKWVFVATAGAGAVFAIVGIPLLSETFHPVLRIKLAHKLPGGGPPRRTREETLNFLWINLTRPIILLFTNIICFMFGLYIAFITGIYYLMFTTFGPLFSEVYGFGPGPGGLTYLGMGIGFLIATVLGGNVGNKIYHHLAAKNGGPGIPEYRLPPLIFGSFIIPIGLFWYGWSAEAQIHWIMPIIGTGIFGFAFTTVFLPVQLYAADAFKYAASAISAVAVLRSVLGFAFPLFGQAMYDKLGTGGGNSLLAGLSIVLGIPFPIWIYYYGERFRVRSNVDR